MRRIVVDTSVYIDWFNAGTYEDILFRTGTVSYLSAIVLMELRAGAFARSDLRLLRRLEAAFARAGRILVPPRATFTEAGDTLRRLQSELGYDVAGRNAIANDVLIALSARSIGAAVVTQNARDFQAIAKVRRFRLEVVPA